MANLTLVFVKYKNKLLMINRNNKPFMGMWNALGGHQEKNESIFECACREIKEEGNIEIENMELISKFTWNFDDDITYVYVATLNDNFNINGYPKKNEEGLIDFKDIDWLIDENNFGIVPDLRLFISNIKNNVKQDYHLEYSVDGRLLNIIKK